MDMKAVSGLYAANAGAGLRSFVKGMDYFRFRENLMITGELEGGGAPGKKLLDVGCGEETFGIFLARQGGFAVHAVDIDAGKTALQRRYWERLRNGRGSFEAVRADARRLPFPDGAFDAVTCCAVLPLLEGDGDCGVMREIGRVLKPGGRAYVTVGFGEKYREQCDTLSTRGFSRVYDEAALQTRLTAPAALEEEKRLYFGQAVFPFSEWWYRLPFPLKLPFRWLIPLCTLAFLRSIDPADRPGLAPDTVDGILLILRKSRAKGAMS
jgi:ubiquinone/menaquinone biosynthesis C-methylase UbiE